MMCCGLVMRCGRLMDMCVVDVSFDVLWTSHLMCCGRLI